MLAIVAVTVLFQFGPGEPFLCAACTRVGCPRREFCGLHARRRGGDVLETWRHAEKRLSEALPPSHLPPRALPSLPLLSKNDTGNAGRPMVGYLLYRILPCTLRIHSCPLLLGGAC